MLQPFGQIVQSPETRTLVFVDPTLGDLLERRRIQIMQFFAATPKRDDQVRFDEQTKVFGDPLTSHSEMPAKLI